MTDLAKMEIKINFKVQLIQDGIAIAIAIAIANMNMDGIAAMIVIMVMVMKRNYDFHQFDDQFGYVN